jgi:hypothetical protein
MEKKYLEERNILFAQLTEQEPYIYDKRSVDCSRRDITDFARCRIQQEMKDKNSFLRKTTEQLTEKLFPRCQACTTYGWAAEKLPVARK